MKKYLMLFTLLLVVGTVFSQVSYMQYRHVPDEHMQEFEKRETQYWSKVAKAAIDEGKMTGWSLWRKVGVSSVDAPNYIFVNSFESLDQMNMGGVWSDAAETMGVDPDLVETYSMSTVTFDYYMQLEDVLPGSYDYAIVNYARPTSLQGFIAENKELWKPFHASNIENASNGMASWGLMSVIYGRTDRFSCFTWDGFNSLTDALKYMRPVSGEASESWQDILSKSKMGELMPDGFERRMIYQRVMTVSN